MQDGQCKSRCLSGTSLGCTHDITASHDFWQRLRLNRRGYSVSSLFNRLKDQAVQANRIKGWRGDFGSSGCNVSGNCRWGIAICHKVPISLITQCTATIG